MKPDNLSIADLTAAIQYITHKQSLLKSHDPATIRMWQDWEWKRQDLQAILIGKVHFLEFSKPVQAHYDEVFPPGYVKPQP